MFTNRAFLIHPHLESLIEIHHFALLTERVVQLLGDMTLLQEDLLP